MLKYTPYSIDLDHQFFIKIQDLMSNLQDLQLLSLIQQGKNCHLKNLQLLIKE